MRLLSKWRMRRFSRRFLENQLDEWRKAHSRWSAEKFRLTEERDRFRATLEEIRDRDWVENALDPQWPAKVAREVLSDERA